MTMRERDDGVWVITHTGVPPELRGRGIAEALLNRAASDARAQGKKIEPRCSYVETAFSRRSDLSDVRA